MVGFGHNDQDIDKLTSEKINRSIFLGFTRAFEETVESEKQSQTQTQSIDRGGAVATNGRALLGPKKIRFHYCSMLHFLSIKLITDSNNNETTKTACAASAKIISSSEESFIKSSLRSWIEDIATIEDKIFILTSE